MATEKRKPSSAPELTVEQQQAIEGKMSVEQTDKAPIAEQDLLAAGKDDEVASVEASKPDDAAPAQPGRLRRLVNIYWHHKLWSIPLTLLAIVALLGVVPASRYALAGYVISQPVTVTVTDTTTKKPVSSADVRLEGKTYKTDKDGKVTIKDVKVGDRTVSVSKKYYKDANLTVFVPIGKDVDSKIQMTATGRQVPVVAINKVSGKPLENVTLKSAGTEVKTDKDGKAVIVLPADKVDLPVSLSNGGFNALDARVKVTDQAVKENTFSLTPSGKVYFLSRQSGKIDVVKTDLDGTNRQVIVQGTGKEEDRGTVLLASRDWKYLALLSKRDSSLPRLYVIDTSTDKMSEMDSGDASFSLVGWDEHTFVYRVDRNKPLYYESNKTAFKSYSADKKQITTIDQTTSVTDGGNTIYQQFGNASLIDHKLVYTITPGVTHYSTSGKANILRASSLDSNNKKDVRSWPTPDFFNYGPVLYAPGELYIAIYSVSAKKVVFFEYEDGAVKDVPDVDDSKFQSSYPTYLASPDGKRTFWSEQRDGRQTFFVGDASGDNGKQVAAVEDGQVFGWYGDGYLLLSKKGSELSIMSVDGGGPLKVADYHKPQLSYRGYGGGYGGL